MFFSLYLNHFQKKSSVFSYLFSLFRVISIRLYNLFFVPLSPEVTIKFFAHGLYQSLFSKSTLLKNNYAKNSGARKARCATPFASLGLISPQIEPLEARITPASKPTFALTQTTSLIFITQDLIGKVPQQELANASVVTLTPNQDVISQISTELAKHRGLETLRIVSHGGDGTLYFGSQVVNQGVVVGRGEEISAWGRAMVPGADILLYGCSVASSEAGRSFVTTLAGLTGADVAASSNPTGAGGDTVLEFSAGAVQSGLLASGQEWEAAHLQLPQSGDFYYSSSGSAITITGYVGAGGAVTIPSTITGLPVTTIGYEAFSLKSTITSIFIPNSVTTIGPLAFQLCSGLTSVTIPNSVTTIFDAAFVGCSSLTSVTIPNSVTAIGSEAFGGCSSLTVINVEANNFNYSSADGILFNKLKTTLIQCPGGKTGSVSIPNSVTTIGFIAFCNCTGLTSITIPNSVTIIDDYAFSSCSGLTSVTIPNSVTSIANNTFSYCSNLTSVTIPNSVITIGPSAFQYCSGLTIVTIPNSVTAIGDSAFQYCSGLTSVTIPNSVTTIGNSAFWGCTSLISVSIGSGVTSIGSYAFYYNPLLTSAYFLGNAPTRGSEVFTDSYQVTIYYLSGATGFGSSFGGRPTALFTINTTNIAITNASIIENTQANSIVGSLSSTSTVTPGAISNILPPDSFTYALVGGTGSSDNASFSITSSSLKLTPSPNFEAKSSYAVRLRTTDAGGGAFEKQFTITITNVNEAPTDITLSNSSVAENSAVNSVVGTLSSTDVDAGDSFTYSLISGTGDTDNASFTITGSSLKISVVPDFETKTSYSVRARTTDAAGATFEKQFTINIINFN